MRISSSIIAPELPSSKADLLRAKQSVTWLLVGLKSSGLIPAFTVVKLWSALLLFFHVKLNIRQQKLHRGTELCLNATNGSIEKGD